MKVLILNTDDWGSAPNRIMQALRKNGVDAKMLVRGKYTDDENVYTINGSWLAAKINFLRFVWERIVIFANNRFSRKDLFKVSIANTGAHLASHPLVREADILHLHWINQGFLSLKGIQALINTGKPIVWTMHDWWLLTGICGYPWQCGEYSSHCGECPLLHSARPHDLSYKVFKKKKALIAQSKIKITAVSSYIKRMAQKSPITKDSDIAVVPNVLDLKSFQPSGKAAARETLGLPADKKIVVMGAVVINNPIKGFRFLKEAMRRIYESDKDVALALFGNIKDRSILDGADFPVIEMGTIREMPRLALLYSAADVNVVPSYCETFGQTITEAMACGCPSVTFDNGGQTDIIDHKEDGYLAKYLDEEDLAAGIRWALAQDASAIAGKCIKKAREKYCEDVVAKQYIDLYNSLLK